MTDIFRPLFHFTPPNQWMNDPNGMVFDDGEYHLFYQYHPDSTIWGPMHWGHAISRDLLIWKHLPIALFPDELGMIFSGSAVIDETNTAGFGLGAMVLLFTYHKDGVQSQGIAYSLDHGRTFTKYPGNPVIPAPSPAIDFRDPKVIWYHDHWVLLLAAKDEIQFFRSKNLIDWRKTGSFGGAGCVDGVWETPDLFELQIDGMERSAWVLTVGVGEGLPAGSGTQYFIGNFDGDTFSSIYSSEFTLWADRGSDYYAPQSFSHAPMDRRIMIGWMSNWKYANATPDHGWRGTMSTPRQQRLTGTSAGLRLCQDPILELESKRQLLFTIRNKKLEPGIMLIREVYGKHLDICLKSSFQDDVKPFGFYLRVGAGNRTVLTIDPTNATISLDRRASGSTDFHPSFPTIHTATMPSGLKEIDLRILLDSCSVEVFFLGGSIVLTDLIFPPVGTDHFEIFSNGDSVTFEQLDVYALVI